MARLFDHDPLVGSKEFFHYDESSDQAIIETVADVAPVVEDAEASRQKDPGNWRGDHFGHRVASIPLVIWNELIRQGIASDDKLLLKWINDPAFRKLRTKGGRV